MNWYWSKKKITMIPFIIGFLYLLIVSLTSSANANYYSNTQESNKVKLILHLSFINDSSAKNSVDRKSYKIKKMTRSKKRSAFFSGHPDQGINLGVLNVRQPVTIAFWIRRKSFNNNIDTSYNAPEYRDERNQGKGRLISAYGPARNKYIGSLRIGPEKLEIWHDGNKWGTLITDTFPLEKWLHIAITIDANCQAMGYMDGVEHQAIRSCFDFGQNTVVLFGTSQNRYGFPFAGGIADIRIYHGVLKKKTITRLARNLPKI